MTDRVTQLSLESFHEKWLNAYNFSRRAHVAFRQLRSSKDGMTKIRKREHGLPKKLIEEILPLARFAMLHMSPENDLRVRWVDGSQSFDAQFKDLGYGATAGRFPKSGFIEVTSAYHPNSYVGRKLMNEGRGFWGLDGLSVDRKSGQILAAPAVRTSLSAADQMAEIAMRQIERKARIEYPKGKTLIVDFCSGTRFDPHEWAHLKHRLSTEVGSNQFHRIFLLDSLSDWYCQI